MTCFSQRQQSEEQRRRQADEEIDSPRMHENHLRLFFDVFEVLEVFEVFYIYGASSIMTHFEI